MVNSWSNSSFKKIISFQMNLVIRNRFVYMRSLFFFFIKQQIDKALLLYNICSKSINVILIFRRVFFLLFFFDY